MIVSLARRRRKACRSLNSSILISLYDCQLQFGIKRLHTEKQINKKETTQIALYPHKNPDGVVS